MPIARFTLAELPRHRRLVHLHPRVLGVAASPLVAGVIFNLWLYRRRHLGAVIVAHAAANASLWLAVVLGPESVRMFL